MENIWFISVLLTVLFTAAAGLECFNCDEQDWNHHDCTHKRQVCDAFQDSCTTYIRFGVPDSFNQRNYRRYFISKGCDTRSGCDKRQVATQTACQKSYWNDWACVECCTGDLCNFHVIHLSGSSIKASMILTLFTVLAAWCWKSS